MAQIDILSVPEDILQGKQYEIRKITVFTGSYFSMLCNSEWYAMGYCTFSLLFYFSRTVDPKVVGACIWHNTILCYVMFIYFNKI